MRLWPTFAAVVMLAGFANSSTAQENPDARVELLRNGSFGGLAPWWTTDTLNARMLSDGAWLEMTDAGENPWDAVVGQHEISVFRGGAYTLRFEARAGDPVTVRVVLQENGDDYTPHFSTDVALTPDFTDYAYGFVADADDEAATFQFQMGGGTATTVCLADVSLKGQLRQAAEASAEPLPSIRVNQHAYLPGAAKVASVVSEAQAPLNWVLRDANGEALLSGATTVFGFDESSQDTLHTVDFSAFTEEGSGYRLEVAGEASHPFDIRADAYETLKYDALRYFYHNRSGIDIEARYTGGGRGSYAADAQWARPAGHLSQGVNRGDYNVPCWPEEEGAARTCDYTLDVTKGWYDAGDHGKYLVNGGISTWTLMNLFKRGKRSGDESFGDGALNLPESGNGVPDLLDEGRWNLEFMLAMQVPEGEWAGTAHHKVHEFGWMGLGLAPHENPRTRYLAPPSVTATLNLAAVGAQCARVWREVDPAFSARCLSAAEKAWEAARAHPNLYYDNCCNNGGGPYDDDDASDEFYWAAAELFITTGEEAYKDYMEGSSHYLHIPVGDVPTSVTWGDTAALGNLSLLTAPNGLSDEAMEILRGNILAAADRYARLVTSEGYGLPFTAHGGEFPWGSNSFVLNNALVLGVAYDLTQSVTYLDAVTQSMDYLLGRNAMDQSYLTGYGERPLKNPHHRFWAFQADGAYPPPPPGAVSGGPNTGLDDPVAAARLVGCAPQKCFVDDIGSWSTNEVTINWNAPLAWVAAFLDSAR